MDMDGEISRFTLVVNDQGPAKSYTENVRFEKRRDMAQPGQGPGGFLTVGLLPGRDGEFSL
jgi:hypothetical protein